MKSTTTLMIVLIVLCCGCDTPKSHFSKAQKANTIETMEAFLAKYPQSEYSAQAKNMLDKLEFDKAKSLNSMKAFDLYLSRCPEAVSLKKEKSLDSLISLIRLEDAQLLKKFLRSAPESSLKNYAKLILCSQSALETGDLGSLVFPISADSDSSYAKDLNDIVLALKANTSINQLQIAANLASRGDIVNLFPILVNIQARVDNRLLRHTLAKYITTAFENFKIPRTVTEIAAFEKKKAQYSKLLESKLLVIGAKDDKHDYGNVAILTSQLTLTARMRRVLIDLPRQMLDAGQVDFYGMLNLVQKLGQVAGSLNYEVVAGAKFLLEKEYLNLDIKGRYAVLQWIKYLMVSVDFKQTLQVGDVQAALIQALAKEQDSFLQKMGQELIAALNRK